MAARVLLPMKNAFRRKFDLSRSSVYGATPSVQTWMISASKNAFGCAFT